MTNKDHNAELAAVGNDTGLSTTETASRMTVAEAKELMAKWRGREKDHRMKQHENEAAIGNDLGQRVMRNLCREAAEDIADLIACYAALEKQLAGNQGATSGIASPAASPAK